MSYVVRISTTAANVHPDCNAYYPRTHWAIEALLSSPGFKGLQWISLQPDIFSAQYLYTAVEWIKNDRKEGRQELLRLMTSADAPAGVIEFHDVGIVAAYLLFENPAAHNKANYVLNGLKDILGSRL